MISGILKSQFGSVFWYHGLVVFLMQHNPLGLEGRSCTAILKASPQSVADESADILETSRKQRHRGVQLRR